MNYKGFRIPIALIDLKRLEKFLDFKILENLPKHFVDTNMNYGITFFVIFMKVIIFCDIFCDFMTPF